MTSLDRLLLWVFMFVVTLILLGIAYLIFRGLVAINTWLMTTGAVVLSNHVGWRYETCAFISVLIAFSFDILLVAIGWVTIFLTWG